MIKPRSAGIRAIFVVVCLMMFTHHSAISSPAAVSGRIVDAEDGGAIAGALVTLSRGDVTELRVISDVDGRFQIGTAEAITPEHQLAVSSIGYRTQHFTAPFLDNLKVLLVPHAGEDDPIVVIGRSSTARRENVGTATQISSKTIRLVNPIGTQEMLEYVPGINGFADDGMGNSRLNIGIRGLNPRRSARLLVLEDGIPIQPAPYIYPNMYYNPPTERIERIEVLKGSAALEHGPQTMGGIVNYITRRPRNTLGGRLQATGGMNGFLSVYGEVAGVGSEVFRSEAAMLVKRGSGYRENNSFLQLNGTLKFVVIPSDDRIVYVKVNGNHEVSNATYTGLTEYSFENDPTFNPKDEDEFTVDRLSLDIILSDRIGDESTVTTRAYANYFDRDWWREDDVFFRADEYEANPAAATPVPWFEPGDLVRAGNGRTNFGILRRFFSVGLERRWNLVHSAFGSNAKLATGGRIHFERFLDHRVAGTTRDARAGDFFRFNEADSTTTILGSNRHYETVALSLFARESITFGPLSITAGLRFEAFEQEQVDRLDGARLSDKTSLVLLPGIGLNYGVGQANVFAGLHRGYTPPSSGAIKVAGLRSAVDDTGIDLLPEQSWNGEIGVRGSYPAFSFEVAAFGVEIEDMVAAGRGTVFRNLGMVRSLGIESGLSLRPRYVWDPLPDVNVAATLLRGTVLEGVIPSALIAGDVPVDISGNELPYAPRWTITAGISREIGSTLNLRADIHWVSRSYTDFENIEETSSRGDTGPIPGRTTLSAGLQWNPVERWQVSLVGKNLLDEVYVGSRLHSNPRQPDAGASSGIIPGARRQVNLGATYRFGQL